MTYEIRYYPPAPKNSCWRVFSDDAFAFSSDSREKCEEWIRDRNRAPELKFYRIRAATDEGRSETWWRVAALGAEEARTDCIAKYGNCLSVEEDPD